MAGRGSSVSAEREIYIEFYPLGNAVKVSAVDAETGVEVSITGPRTASRSELQRVAVQKLKRALARR